MQQDYTQEQIDILNADHRARKAITDELQAVVTWWNTISDEQRLDEIKNIIRRNSLGTHP